MFVWKLINSYIENCLEIENSLEDADAAKKNTNTAKQTKNAGSTKQTINTLSTKQIKGGKNKLWFEKGIFCHSKADNFKSGETAWACGGSAMFDKKKWLKLGGFNKIYYPLI